MDKGNKMLSGFCERELGLRCFFWASTKTAALQECLAAGQLVLEVVQLTWRRCPSRVETLPDLSTLKPFLSPAAHTVGAQGFLLQPLAGGEVLPHSTIFQIELLSSFPRRIFG